MSPDEAKAKLAFWREKAEGYVRHALNNGGRYKRSDGWYHEYCISPYLSFASDEYLALRFIDQYHNNLRITSEGKIAPRTEFADDGGNFGPLFSHLLLEYNARGGVPKNVISKANAEFWRYFHADGRAKGAALFEAYPDSLEGVIVKYGKFDHLQRMLSNGEVRCTPAGGYSRASLLKAMRDLETKREFHLTAYDEIARGQTNFQVQDLTAPIVDGFVQIVVECPNYMLWCACLDIDRRMPVDFEADAALIIRNPEEFARRFIDESRKKWASLRAWFGPVTYYDPCSHVHMMTRPETIKHFSYAYQKEWRLCLIVPEEEIPEDAVSIHLGPLTDIAELVVAQR